MRKKDLKLISFLVMQEMACGIAFIPYLHFQDSIIRYN